MNIIFFLLCILFSFLQATSEYAAEYEAIYQQIPDIYHPTYADFLLVQNYLNNGERPYLQWLDTFYPGSRNDGLRMDRKMRNMKLIDPKRHNSRSKFELQKVYFNNDPKNKECAIVSYASCNSNYGYPKKIRRRIDEHISKKTKGHYLYRIGGWPDLEGGSLRLAHVPYAFKVCMMKEAMRLGYKKVLWLDTSMKPLKNINKIFDIIESKGYFVLYQRYSLNAYGSEISRKAFDMTFEEYKANTEVVGGIIGINFDHPNGRAIYEAWLKAAEDLDPFLSPRSDQPVLGAIMYKLNLPFIACLDDICAIYKDHIEPRHYFYINY